MPTQEMRVVWHPTRALLLELLKLEPTLRSELVRTTRVPLASIAYHCRALCSSGCTRVAPSSRADAPDPLYEAA